MKNLRYYFFPYFIAKYYIFKDIKNILKKNNFRGNLLDIGCGEKPYKDLFKDIRDYQGIDFKRYSINKDFRGEEPECFFSDDYSNSLNLPYKNESFDNVVSFQVLEHHKDPKKMINEIYRVVKPNGYILLTVPFLGGIHEEPNDYQRFTKYGLIQLFKPYKCKILKIKEQGSVFSTVSLLFNEYLNDFASISKLHYLISILIYLPFILFSYFALILDIFFKSDKIFFNYLVLVKKI